MPQPWPRAPTSYPYVYSQQNLVHPERIMHSIHTQQISRDFIIIQKILIIFTLQIFLRILFSLHSLYIQVRTLTQNLARSYSIQIVATYFSGYFETVTN